MRKRIPFPLIIFLIILILPLLCSLFITRNGDVYLLSLDSVLDLFYSVIALLSAIYFLALFLYDHRQLHNLYFSLFCCFTGFLGIFSNQILSNLIFSMHFTTAEQLMLRDMLLILCLFVALLYSRSLFPKILSKKFIIVISILFGSYLIACILWHQANSLQFLFLRLILQFVCGCLCLHAAILQILRHNPGSTEYIVGSAILLLSIPLELLDYYLILPSNHFLLAGFVSYICLQVNVLIRHDIETHQKEYAIYTSYMDTLSSIKKEETNLISSYLRPHFLFNALNIIGGYCLIDTHRARELTNALTTFLTQLFEHDNLSGQTPLAEEVALMQSYGMIQAERFTFLHIRYDIPDKLPKIMLPSLTLQPLLDNAINHGVRKKNAKGEVVVTIRADKTYITFEIYDTGVGITDEQLPSLLIQKEDGQFHSLYHINARLKEQFRSELHIESSQGVGTNVSFQIPLT